MWTRRSFLGGSLAVLAACRRGPLIQTKQPRVTHGVQSGDPQTGSAVVWARCDEPARMLIEWDTSEQFASPRRVTGPLVTADHGHAGTATIGGLPDGQTIAYRVRFEREAARGASAWSTGRFRTPRSDAVRVAWTGDTCGQGFGRSPDWGGLKGYGAILAAQPDVFVNSGDLMYADNPILAEKPLADGRVWKNITNERVARVAETLDDFRARFEYNYDDEHLRALAAAVPLIAQWDDHEIHNNWWPHQQLPDPRYKSQRDASVLAGYALAATREWTPIGGRTIHRVLHYGPLLDVFVLDCRSFRTPNDANTGTAAMLGADQLGWLLAQIKASRARWKLVACDQPIALAIDDGPVWEGWANNVGGAASGREVELAQLLPALTNAVWITADVHYAAAHHFDPARATGTQFQPFWEFVAGPIHAGNFGPNPVDPTFGPEVKYTFGTPAEGQQDVGPWDGKQSFGTIDVARDALTVTLRDGTGTEQHRVEIPYAG
ncbi:MAG: alkaline phosphatase D family protein [Kofleriaceae bacterium]